MRTEPLDPASLSAAAPTGLRAVAADAWAQGFDAAIEAMHGDASHDHIPNPYAQETSK